MDGRAQEWLEAGGFFDWVPAEPMRHTRTIRVFHAQFGDPEAPTLLLLHGFPTSSLDWYDVVASFSRDHRVCVLDFPGFGFSDKPQDEAYSLHRDTELVEYYLSDIVGAPQGTIVAHDRGDSVALIFADRCRSAASLFNLNNLVLSNANLFLPLSNLTEFQRLMLDRESASSVLEVLTPEVLASGMGEATFTPPRPQDDPAIAALAQAFAFNDGLAVIHPTIQYLFERAEHEQEWLESLAGSPVPTTLVWGLYDVVSPLRVASHVWNAYLSAKPGRNEFWLLPLANHYLQHDQPQAFVEAVSLALAERSPVDPGALSPEPGAPILVDRSRARLLSANEVLAAT